MIIGGGHNGLVTAAYLAKGGLTTLVLERRERVGGAADTSELGKGIRVPTLAHTVGRLRPVGPSRPGPQGHGLSLLAPDVRVFAPSPDGSAVTLWDDVEKTAAGLRVRSAVDADAYPASTGWFAPSAASSTSSAGRRRPTSARPGSATR